MHEILGLRVVGIRDAGLDVGEEVDQSHGVGAKPLAPDSQSNERGTLHGFGAEKPVLLLILVLEDVDEQRHQSVVVLGERCLGGISNGCDG